MKKYLFFKNVKAKKPFAGLWETTKQSSKDAVRLYFSPLVWFWKTIHGLFARRA
jgi:hypothetical protein